MYGFHEHYFPQQPKSSFFREIRTFAMIFGIVFVIILVFTNLNLFAYNFRALFENEIHPIDPITTSIVSENNTISTILDTAERHDAEIQ